MQSQKFSASSRKRSLPTKRDTWSGSVMLTRSEIESLRRDKKTISDYVQKEFPAMLEALRPLNR